MDFVDSRIFLTYHVIIKIFKHVRKQMGGRYIDLQVNGYRGINFSDPGLSAEDIRTVSRLLGDRGVAAYCPTLISSPHETYAHNLPLLASAAGEEGPGARILGIHLEGPFLNPAPGPRGIHEAENIVPPNIDYFHKLSDLCQDTLALITIAPDQSGSTELIEHICSTTRAAVSLGHHLAGEKQIKDAVEAGARAATHVGNGLPTMIHRHENPLWTILSDDRLYAFFIADGYHLPQALTSVILRSKPPGKLIITSDLMHLGGLPSGSYEIGKLKVLLEKNGRLHQEGSSQLAGASLPIDRCAEYMEKICGVSKERVHAMTYTNPLKLLDKTL